MSDVFVRCKTDCYLDVHAKLNGVPLKCNYSTCQVCQGEEGEGEYFYKTVSAFVQTLKNY